MVDDPAGRVVVFPPGAWAVLTAPRIAHLRAALQASTDDESTDDDG